MLQENGAILREVRPGLLIGDVWMALQEYAGTYHKLPECVHVAMADLEGEVGQEFLKRKVTPIGQFGLQPGTVRLLPPERVEK